LQVWELHKTRACRSVGRRRRSEGLTESTVLIDCNPLGRLLQPTAFQWLAGIEDGFIPTPSPITGRGLDQYELTQHYERWREDVALLAQLRVRMVRYGIPWHRVNPGPGVWDFGCTDGPLEALLARGIQPLVGLLHYGTPPWLVESYLARDFAERMAEYAARVAERYRGRIYFYTPLNEPRVSAWYGGKLGLWPPHRRGWQGFVRVTLALSRAVVRSAQALREVDPNIVCAHVDGADLYTAASPDLELEAYRRQDLAFLVLDLVTGRLQPGHALFEWLLANGAKPAELAWFEEHAIAPDLIGMNIYPQFSDKRLMRTRAGLRMRMPQASGELVERLAHLYWNRYHRPLFISQTACEGSAERRLAWLDASVAATARVREANIPLVGYTWWPLYALVTWNYREGRKAPDAFLRQMGLWDLRPGGEGLDRVRTCLVERYRALAGRGAAAVGILGAPAAARRNAAVE
jgi:beta-glucosidase/6-phospho-beta-glucosidase/beta-galactosidase